MQYLKADTDLGEVIPNIALMLERSAVRFPDHIVYAEKQNGSFKGIAWKIFIEQIQTIASNLSTIGFKKGDKMIVFSPNRLEMLQLELAVMASGGISVPIFAYFHKETAESLIKHSNARFLAVAGELQLSRIDSELPLNKIISFDKLEKHKHQNLISFSELLSTKSRTTSSLLYDAPADDTCLNMYTSGTMGTPKCVQLTHQNILSQQAALKKIWEVNENDRFLSYLPWHHSFGGIFERFSALYNGAAIYQESGHGKDPKIILENWKTVQPNLFFSVPKVYQSLVDLSKADKEAEKLFFHSGLKFIFTAAAALPQKISEEFERRSIPVIEGWGLTETSPCCTLTDPALKRENGVVGKPIPGVNLRITDDGEIQVKGPNVMKGYYNNDEANKEAFSDDGWYCTGDVGKFTPNGLKLISRKDRIFKLTNGEKVIPSEVEGLIQTKCHYITFAVICGKGKEYPVALLFPNKKALDHPNYEISPDEGCFCPKSINELGKCLRGCLHDVNCGLTQKFSKVKYAMIIDDELTIENNTLTPSMKVAPNRLMETYKAHIENLYGEKNSLSEDVYIIKLETKEVMKEKQST